MNTDLALDELIRGRRPGFGLPRPFYTDEQVYRRDLERVFGRCWLFAGHTGQVRRPGDYFLFEVGGDSLIVRGDDGRVRALFNTCRHRGSRLCTLAAGHVGKFVCPYHQWAYERDGRLAARWMGEGFDRSDYPLHQAHVRVAAGLISVSLTRGEPPDFEPAGRAIEEQLRPHGIDRAKVCHVQSYTVGANWKLLFENHRECYHCPVGHPEFCKTNYHTNMPDDGRADDEYPEVLRAKNDYWRSLGLATGEVNFPGGEWYRVARVPLREGYVTESLDGRPVGPVMGGLTTRDSGSARVITFPNAWSHADSDYVMATQLFPLGPERTEVRITWLVHEDAREGEDYDRERVIALWKITTEQDFTLCEGTQAGVRSSRYRPGPLSPLAESGVEVFTSWYLPGPLSPLAESGVEVFTSWYLRQLGSPAPPAALGGCDGAGHRGRSGSGPRGDHD
ncbi:MAG: aromatic ring-hydroxylating dioxygenase subunit alpha [Gemmataceae bacterium]|nr:aromatic ring-hydroxylating dioxygenase subunit alpha [Gemmataceae bacterium]